MNGSETTESSPLQLLAADSLREAAQASQLNTPAAFLRTKTPMDIKTLRVAEYGACQMLLDALYSATASSGRDLESVWIMACVLHNTLRNLVTDPHISARYLNQEDVPDHIYMTMSRRAIADKTGLSRETVRRRTNKLIEDGVLIEINGNVRLGYRTRSREDIANVNLLYAAAQTFMKTVQDQNARMPMELPER
jgi:biotin operon repressor